MKFISDASFFSELLDPEELDLMTIEPQFKQKVLPLSNRFDITCILYEGGTLVVDSFSAINRKNSIFDLIRLLENIKFKVTRIRFMPLEDVKSIISNRVYSLEKTFNKVIDKAETLNQFKSLMSKSLEIGSEDIYITLSQKNDISYAQFKVDGVLLPELYPLKDYLFGKSMCAAIYDGGLSAGSTIGTFDEVTTPQEKMILHTVYGQNGEIIDSLTIRFTKKKTLRIGELLVNMRVLKKAKRLDELGLSDKIVAELRSLVYSGKGAIINSGRMGSGKSTTNFAILLEYPRTKVIHTFEDPVEVEKPKEFTNITQNSLDITTSYIRQLRASMRMALDGILVQEIRDHETADFVFYIANTGHFVLTTLHTSSAISIPSRLVDLGIPRSKLAQSDSIDTLLHQYLVRKLCPNCKLNLLDIEYSHPNIFSTRSLVMENNHTKLTGSVYVKNPKGCHCCRNRGESGRQLLIEIIKVDAIGRKYIRNGDTESWLKYLKSEKGFETVFDQMSDLIKEGEVDPIYLAEVATNEVAEDRPVILND